MRLTKIIALASLLIGIPAIAASSTSHPPSATILPEVPYAHSGINTGIFRRHALVTIGNLQLIAYFAGDGNAAFVQRSTLDGAITRTVKLDSHMSAAMLGDGHQGISLGCDGNGIVHAIWGCHDASNPQYIKLRWSDLSTCESDFNELGLGTDQLTYPQFYGPPNRLLLAFRRNPGDVGRNPYDHCLIRFDSAEGKWKPLQLPLLMFPPAPQLAYFNSMGESDNILAGAYVIRRYDLMDTTDPHMRVLNDSFRVIWSRDSGQSWVNLAGKQLKSPIPALVEPPDIPIPPGQNLINSGGGWLDKKQHYHIGYFKNDDNAIPQIYLTSLDLGKNQMTTLTLSQRKQPFDLLGRGTQTWPISRPAVFELGSTLVVSYREEDRLMAVYRTNPKALWKSTELFTGKLGNYEPILDYTRLDQGVVTFYIQESRQGSDDQASKEAISTHALLLDLSEAQLQALPPLPIDLNSR